MFFFFFFFLATEETITFPERTEGLGISNIFKQRAVLCLTQALTCVRKARGEIRSAEVTSALTTHLMPA